MGQEEILNCLERSKRPLSISEISVKIKLGARNVQRGLKIMLKYEEIEKIERQPRRYVYQVSGGCGK